MADEQSTPQAEPAPAPAPQAAPAMSAQEIQDGKVFAILCYALSFLSLPFFVIPLIMRNNDFALYHAKQALIIWLAAIALSVVSAPLTVICVGVVLWVFGGIFLLVVNVMGLLNAINAKVAPLPLIGKWGETWFKGLKKA